MWMLESTDKVIYDQESQILLTAGNSEGGDQYVAMIQSVVDGALMIFLGANTDFKSNDGKLRGSGLKKVKGKTHIGDPVLLLNSVSGGTLFFKEGKRTQCDKPQRKRIKLQIKVFKAEDGADKTEGIPISSCEAPQTSGQSKPSELDMRILKRCLRA